MQKNSEIQKEKEILRERYISPKERQKIIDDLRLIQYESRGTYNANNDIKFKTSMIKPNLCDYGDAYIYVKETMTVSDTSAQDVPANDINKAK